MSDSSWPPRVRESHEPDRPRDPIPDEEPAGFGTPSVDAAPQTSSNPRSNVPAPAEPGSAESIGAVDHGRTRVRRRDRRERRAEDEGTTDDDYLEHDEREEDRDDRGPRPDRRRLLTGLLIGGLVLMTALAATFLALWLGSSDVEADDVRSYLDAERPTVEEQARKAVDILINYDSTNIEERQAEMLEISTGGFRENYAEFTPTLGPVLKELGASSRGAILEEPRITFTSPEEADATVRAEQISQTDENPTGRKVSYIMRLGLIKTQGGWKIDNIELLSEEEE